MAGWNGSQGETPKKVEPKKGPAVGKGFLAVLAVVALAGGAWIFFNHKDAALVEECPENVDKTISEVKLAPMPKSKVTLQHKDEVRRETAKVKNPNSVNSDPPATNYDWRTAPTKLTEADFARYRKPSKTRIFAHKSENAIADLLRRVPGEVFPGKRNNAGMTEDFLESCKVPIIITADDDEWTRALKQDMIDTKIEIKNRIDAGERLEDILEETQNELRKLSRIRMEIEREIKSLAILDKSATAQDVSDIREAADKLLERKGIAPLKINPILERRIQKLKREEVKQ